MIIVEICGGLGNQMFGYAFAKSLALRNNDTFLVSLKLVKKDKLRDFGLNHFACWNNQIDVKNHLFLNIIHTFRYYFKKIENLFVKETKIDHLISINDTLHTNNITAFRYKKHALNIYRGLFQNPCLFNDFKSLILEDFKLVDLLNDNEKMLLNKIVNCNSICIHIRRGDYLNSEKHYVCTESYYKNAIDLMTKTVDNPFFVFFSDDMSWVKKHFSLPNSCYSNTSNEYTDLYLMSKCRHFIISNSTFSWWSQYLSLSKDKIVIAPSYWLNGEKERENLIYEKDWYCINPF